MSIKDTKTTVSFIMDKQTREKILRLVEREKRNGRKMTFSSYMNDLAKSHVEAVATLDDLFTVNGAASPPGQTP